MKKYGDIVMSVPLGTDLGGFIIIFFICKESWGKMNASLPSTLASVCKGKSPGVAMIPSCHLGTLAVLQVFAKLALDDAFLSLHE